jgi:hypothetical protein
MRRSNLNQLNSNDRYLLNYYTNLYNQQLRDINMMYNELKEIKTNIDTITGVNNIRRQPLRNLYYRMEYIPTSDLESVEEPIEDASNNIRTSSRRSFNLYRNNTTDISLNEITEELINSFFNRMEYIPTSNLESVPVVASQDIINRNTRSVIFNEVVNPLNYNCPISLERFQDTSILTQIIGCGHLFCNNEITRWFRTNVHCPVCRYDIRDINNVIQEEEPI